MLQYAEFNKAFSSFTAHPSICFTNANKKGTAFHVPTYAHKKGKAFPVPIFTKLPQILDTKLHPNR